MQFDGGEKNTHGQDGDNKIVVAHLSDDDREFILNAICRHQCPFSDEQRRVLQDFSSSLCLFKRETVKTIIKAGWTLLLAAVALGLATIIHRNGGY